MKTWLVSVTMSLTLGACVSQTRYDATAAEGRAATAESARRGQELERLRAAVAGLQTQLADRDRRVAQLELDRSNLDKSLEEAKAVTTSLRGELTRVERDLRVLLAERQRLEHALDEAKRRLDATADALPGAASASASASVSASPAASAPDRGGSDRIAPPLAARID